ncbi:MAG: TSUP family transporter [Faecousia sp.]
MSALLAGIAGLVCGVFSGLGIGGGTLLMVWMTAVMDMEQRMAQGINLLYFLPTAACALIFHIKNRLIRWRVVIPAVIAGCLTAAGAALLATAIDASLLRKLFGGFLILVGLNEIFGSHARDKKDK